MLDGGGPIHQRSGHELRFCVGEGAVVFKQCDDFGLVVAHCRRVNRVAVFVAPVDVCAFCDQNERLSRFSVAHGLRQLACARLRYLRAKHQKQCNDDESNDEKFDARTHEGSF